MRLIGTGDSIIVAKHSGYQGFLQNYKAAYPLTQTFEVAKSGEYIQYVMDKLATIRGYCDPEDQNVVLVNVCTNNINNANASNWTAEAFARRLREHQDTVLSGLVRPHTKVLFNTIIARKMAGGVNVQQFRELIRLQLNDMMRSEIPDHVIDLAALAEFQATNAQGDPAGGPYYVAADMTHLTAAGYTLASTVVNPAIAGAWS